MNPLITSDLDLAAPDTDPDFDERNSDEVTNITPDDSMESLPDAQETATDSPRADDYEAMKREYFKEIPDLETAAEAIHTWQITGWNSLPKREKGPTFDCGTSPWRVLFFPFGNMHADHTSFYLEHGYDDKPPEDWYACVQFMLVLWNPNDPTIQSRHTATHRFNAEESDWGFTKFYELRKLAAKANHEGRPLVENESANMTAYVRIVKDPTGVLWHSFINYDSKKETGMIGLKNQGATCYLNSLLQSLYFTNSFRRAVYMIPTESETDVRDNSAYALQRLFYQIQSNEHAISTTELTTSFGWESRQIFEQQDVQELSRILMDRMEERMKGTAAEKALPDLFVGKMKTYIDCINVPYESSRFEDYWDIQLNVRGNATLDDSFKDYIQVETMDGDNKYFAEGYGLQDARKGVIFESFPAVLHLQLKRFEFNFQTESMTKIYDRYEFPEVWDASPYLDKNADQSEPAIYHLHSVLVHSGDLHAGHYYAYIRPTKDGDFYKFDDDRVTKAQKKDAMEENYGGDFSSQANGLGGIRNPYVAGRPVSKQRFMSAYMLVYIRESKTDQILRPTSENDVPAHLERKINEERIELERRRKEKEEAHLYMEVVVGSDANFTEHVGFDIFPVAGAVTADHPSVPKVYRILRATTVGDFNEMVAADLGVDTDLVRPWGLVGRQNGTVRPDVPLVWPDLSLEEACNKMQAKQPTRLWIEVTTRKDNGEPDFYSYEELTDNKSTTTPTLLFLKYFDAKSQTLKGRGHIYIGKHQKVSDLGPLILERMGWPTGINLKLFEEIKAKMIDPMNTKNTFAGAELQHGDIVCFQEVLSDADITALQSAGRYTDPQAFYNYILYKVNIGFSERNAPEESQDEHFNLELSKIMTYDQVAQKVGEHLGVQPDHLRFSTVNASTSRPRATVKRGVHANLASIFAPPYGQFGTVSNPRNDWLFYEVLDMSLSELELKKPVKITLLSEGITKEDVYEVLVPKTGTVSDIFPVLQKKAKLSDELMETLRLYEVHTYKIYKELPPQTSVNNFNEWVTVYAEQTPQEELDADPMSERAVYCFHFEKEAGKAHGVPFKFVVKQDELFKDTRERLSKRTGLKGKQLEKVKFAVVRHGASSKPDYLQDDDVLADKLISSDDQLGLDHVNKNKNAWTKSDVMMIR